MEENSICPVCESGLLKRVIEDFSLEYKGHKITFHDIPLLVCENVSNGCEGSFIQDPYYDLVSKTSDTHLKELRKILKI